MVEASKKKHEASAPSNIALIKYMGKEDSNLNVPTNSSLSFTLDHLRTFVRITEVEGAQQDQWKLLTEAPDEQLIPIEMSEKSKQRYLKHFSFLKKQWGVEKNYLIESANNFPSDCGLASSASSFAALTKTACELFQSNNPNPDFEERQMVEFSRKGSGSSCRSFYGPWTLWHKEGVRPLEFPFGPLEHQVVVVESSKKEVSSSEAHRRVSTSSLFKNRPERAEQRLIELIEAFRKQDWKQSFEICWAEFWDMHALFETSNPSFGYFESGSLDVLKFIRNLWKEKNEGPIVTMDAGANVHLLWNQEQLKLSSIVCDQLSKKYSIFQKGKKFSV